MPTPSEKVPSAEHAAGSGEWAARSSRPPRSVFDNYQPADEPAGTMRDERAVAAREGAGPGANAPLQASIDEAMARSFLYRFLAQAYEDPTPAGWERLVSRESKQILNAAVGGLGAGNPALAESACKLPDWLNPAGFEAFLTSYLEAFGHAARGRCPLNEIEYADLKADPLFQPHRLADIVAFYGAFGLELAANADERQDHLCLELEFLCVLSAKEAYALEHQLDLEDLRACRQAQKAFLRDHLGRWTPAFARRLAQMAGDTALGALANLTRAFIEADCARCGVTPGSEDLLLRPVDEAAESMCASCGLGQLPPGASPPGAAPGGME